MFDAVKYNLRHLLDFAGRDARSTFWYYVVALVVLKFFVGLMVSLPIVIDAMGPAFEAARSGASQEQIQAQMMGRMAGNLGSSLWISVASSVLLAFLMVAAFVRRLHDSDKPGWWALLALAGVALGIAMDVRNIGAARELLELAADPATQQQVHDRQMELARSNLLGWIAPVVVIVFGVMRSTDGPNRYGDAPLERE